MIQILTGVFFCGVAYAIGYGGNFRLPIKKSSLTHRVLGRINRTYNILVAFIALGLPPLTQFAGAPILAYIAAALVIGALFLYPLKLLSLRVRLFPARGQRAKPLAEQERIRLPYAWTCGIGYAVMLAYVFTIAPMYL